MADLDTNLYQADKLGMPRMSPRTSSGFGARPNAAGIEAGSAGFWSDIPRNWLIYRDDSLLLR
jgi:hypothetical protein